MNKKPVSPVMRLSMGLAALTICLILIAELLGLVPDETQAALDARQKFCESLALQLSWAAIRNDRRAIQQTLETVVDRDPDVLSASLSNIRSGNLATIGNHDALWKPPEDGSSTPTNVSVPIFANDGRWGTLELTFKPLQPVSQLSSWTQSSFGLLLFIGTIGFLAFMLFLKRAMRELDPSRVIPGHIKAAFDALAEGVLIVDEKSQIVLANSAFVRLIGAKREVLTGRTIDNFPWYWPGTSSDTMNPAENGKPWQRVLDGEGVQAGIPMALKTADSDFAMLIVNSSPILDGKGEARGVLVTFDDVSELQKNNNELQKTMASLAQSKDEIKRQNQELQFLATRDPLTNCLNRRAMLETFERLFDEARLERQQLCCAMIDIDHFKSFNDRYGHSAGDKVIKYVATTLKAAARNQDVVARYGGEEFCIAMPGATPSEAEKTGNRIRETITQNFPEIFECSRDLTISVGIATILDHKDELEKLINRADDALYHAKNNGRNQVITWSPAINVEAVKPAGSAASVDTDKSMLVQILNDPDETARIAGLAERILAMDSIVEETSGAMHRQHGYDELTGLPHRILFYDRIVTALANSQRDGSSIALLYIDIDFEQANDDAMSPVMSDTLVAEAGDRLAKALNIMIAEKALFGSHDGHALARLGNNEFGVVIPEMSDTEAPTWIVKNLFDALNNPTTHEGEECFINCSIGISLYPYDGNDAESLVGHASQARHLAAAAHGRHNYMFYSSEMNARSYQQVKLENDLRTSLQNNELEVHYQPVYEMDSQKIVSLEALLRWNNQEMGQVGPTMFIHIAEQTGLIHEIGQWTLYQACKDARKWVAKGAKDLRMAVNLSAVQLRSPTLHDDILNVLQETGLPPQNLELEVTETAMLDDTVQANQIIQRLRSSGISIAMDDFGTGFSSLTHLKRLTVDKLKIDRSFVRDVVEDERDAAVVGAIIAMAKQLNLTVVAEGVETRQQLAFLRKRGCDLAQGFLMSRPVTPGEITDMLNLDQIESTAQRQVRFDALEEVEEH